MLHLVSTPIGNLKDISQRALEVLNQVDIILCEDTRRTQKLLAHYKIKSKLLTYNDFNKEKITPKIIKLLDTNEIALVSDAGTPGISDPGFYLVREAIKNDIQITPIPGPSSIISALIVSGLPTDKFSFIGFLPKKENKIKQIIENLKVKDETIIFFESPYRIHKTIEILKLIIPEWSIVICREMTKKFEEVIRSKVKSVPEDLKRKGEFTIVLSQKNTIAL